ncbi:glucosaminidase domain-containing protein [Lactobacillus crispatus]|uniref:Peptidase M23 n=1 Tax=Lactobacillus crispatus TaxID=47770 RepID=A0A120DIW4_9LACO|nr:glucosaminidase domain-containing protein [Lactobacillus crispatus]KWU04668.1 peptidase M23 [Lactobacillus crispatus]
MITNIKRLRQTKRWAGLAAFLLGILAVLSVIYFIVILIAAMGAATDDECDTGGEQGGVVEGRISVIESPKYGQTAMMHIADAVHEKTGISARLLFAQMGQETGNGDSSVAKHDHNFGGMTYSEGSTIGTKGESRGGEGGNYIHYKNLSDFATEWAVTVQNGFKKAGLGKDATVAQYAHAMKKARYYTAAESEYRAGMEAQAKKYDALKGNKSLAKGDGSSDSDNSAEEDCKPINGKWGWPFKSIPKKGPGNTISGEQLFGKSSSRKGNFHDGVDFGTVPYGGQDILAIHGGTVKKIGFQGHTQNDLGMYVWVEGSDGWNVIYQEFGFDEADLKYVKVEVGDKVSVGDKIGHLASNAHGITHVHIGATKKDFATAIAASYVDNGTWKDPIKLIKDGLNNDAESEEDDGLSKTESEARNWIVQRESGGRWDATNPTNPSVYGRYQLKREYLKGDYSHKNQTRAANKYVKDRYGSWRNAQKFWKEHNWY